MAKAKNSFPSLDEVVAEVNEEAPFDFPEPAVTEAPSAEATQTTLPPSIVRDDSYWAKQDAKAEVKMAEIGEALKRPVPANLVSQRQIGGGRMADYIDGASALRLANEVFGWNKWNSDVKSVTQVGDSFYAIVSITAYDTTKTDIGVGTPRNTSAESLDMAIKGAVTDGLKRALRQFGEYLGNSLYPEPKQDAAPAADPTWRSAKPVAPPRAAAPVAPDEDETPNGGTILCEVPGCTNEITDWTAPDSRDRDGTVIPGRYFSAADMAKSRKDKTGKVLCGKHMSDWKKANPAQNGRRY